MGIRDLFKRDKTSKTKSPWKKGKTRSTKTTRTQTKSTKLSWKTPKIQIPGLRTAKRIIALILLVINFFIAQASLTSAAATQPLYWIFLFNAFILLDYLWKTRKKEVQELEWGEQNG